MPILMTCYLFLVITLGSFEYDLVAGGIKK